MIGVGGGEGEGQEIPVKAGSGGFDFEPELDEFSGPGVGVGVDVGVVFENTGVGLGANGADDLAAAGFHDLQVEGAAVLHHFGRQSAHGVGSRVDNVSDHVASCNPSV